MFICKGCKYLFGHQLFIGRDLIVLKLDILYHDVRLYSLLVDVLPGGCLVVGSGDLGIPLPKFKHILHNALAECLGPDERSPVVLFQCGSEYLG